MFISQFKSEIQFVPFGMIVFIPKAVQRTLACLQVSSASAQRLLCNNNSSFV